jgi:hypothetical protein
MKVHTSHSYPATPARVVEVMTDPETLQEKYAALGHRDVRIVEHEVHPDGSITVRSKRAVPMDVPGFAKRFLSPMNTVEQHDEWNPPAADGGRIGTWRVTATGVPVRVGGDLSVQPDGAGATVVVMSGEVGCSIPIVGGKLAAFVGADVERTMHAEEEFNAAMLSRPPTKRRAH